MPFWFLALLFIGSIFAGELMRPRPRDTSKPATLSDFNFPTADETRPIPVVWGTVKVDGPNILWYGDLQTVQLSRKIKSGFFSSTTQSLGYRYSLGVDYALCWGQVNSIMEVRTDNKLAWNAGGVYDPTDPASLTLAVQDTGGGGQEFVVDARTIYGGDADFQIEAGGFGGVYAVCTFYSGHSTTTVNPYMTNVLAGNPVPAYNNICRLVWQGPSNGKYVLNGNFTNEPFKSGYMGISQNLTPIEFTIIRTPNLLSQGMADKWYYVKTFNQKCTALARIATTTSITLSGLQTIDGVALANNDVILVKDQSSAIENGLYIVNSSGVWARTEDDLITGFSISINEGNSNRNKKFNLTNTTPVVIGVSEIGFNEDTSYSLVSKGDANPADCLYELLTTNNWGLKIPINLINFDSFKVAQKDLFHDGFGFSAVWDSPKEVIDVVNELLNYMDGVLYTDLKTGLITLKLARNTYKLEDTLVFDETNAEIISYARAAWSETTNEVRVNYIDRRTEGTSQYSLGTVFKEKAAIVQDSANFKIQNSLISTNISYIGPSNGTVASRLAYRDLRILSTPLIKLTLQASRKASTLRPADVFRLNWSDFNLKIENQAFRVVKIKYGNLSNSYIEIEAVEDVFSIQNSIYTVPTESSWINPQSQEPASMGDFTYLIQEAPYFFSTEDAKLQVFAEKPDVNQTSLNLYAGLINSPSNLKLIDSGQLFTPIGKLNVDMPAYYQTKDTGSYQIVNLDAPSNNAITLGVVRSAELLEIKNGFNLALLKSPSTEEIISFETTSYNVNTQTLTISNIYRGLLDTVPQNHPFDSTLVYFFSYGDTISSTVFNGNTAYASIQSIGQATAGLQSPMSAINLTYRAKRPYAPADVKINGSRGHASVGSGSSLTITWSNRNRIKQGSKVYFQTDSSIPCEASTKIYIDVHNHLGTYITTKGPIEAYKETYTYTDTQQILDNGSEPSGLILHVYSEREGLYSYKAQTRKVEKSTTISNIPQWINPSDSYTPMPDGNAAYIRNIPVIGIPTNGQVLTYNNVSGSWEPASGGGVLSGDVTGASGANTLSKIQGTSLIISSPIEGNIISYSGGNWINGPSQNSKIFTKKASGVVTVNGIGSWQEVNSMFIPFSLETTSNIFCTLTIKIRPTNYTAANKIQFKFILNGFLEAEPYEESKATNPTALENEYKLITIHGVFKNVASGGNVISVYLNDGGTGQNYELYERRLTIAANKSDYNLTFTPASLSPSYWFKAGLLTGLTDNTEAPQLTDFSGNNKHFTQLISANRGIYRTARILDNPAIVFDYTQQQYYNGPNFMTGFTNGEMFIVMKSGYDPPPDGLRTSYMQAGTSGLSVHYPYLTGDVYDSWGSTTRHVFNSSIPFNQWNIYNVVSANGAWICYLNGELIAYDTSNIVAFTNAPKIGTSNGGAYFSGEIAEIFIRNTLLNNQESEQMYDYLNLTYNL